MTYSVWDHANRVYKYYETPNSSAATSSPKPAHLRSVTLGLSPEQAAWPLPSNARLVGQGKYPKGHIASTGLGAFPDFTPKNMILLGGLAYLAWRYFR